MNTHPRTADINAMRVVIAAAGQLANLIALQPAGHNPAAQHASAFLCAHIRRHATATETTELARTALAYFSPGAADQARLRSQAAEQISHITRQAQQTLAHLTNE